MEFFDHEQTIHLLREILHELHKILSLLRGHAATSGKISQLFGGSMPNGVTPGGAPGIFQVTWNGAMKDGDVPVWACDDTAATLTPSADGSTVQVALAEGDTSTQFTLTAKGTNSADAVVTATGTFPVNAPPPPPPQPATGGTIAQIG